MLFSGVMDIGRLRHLVYPSFAGFQDADCFGSPPRNCLIQIPLRI